MDRGLRIRFVLFMLSVVFLVLTFALQNADFSGLRKIADQLQDKQQSPETEDDSLPDSSAYPASPGSQIPMQVSGLKSRDLLDDRFTDNNNDWPLTDGAEAKVKIAASTLTISNKKNNWYTVAKTLDYADEDTIQIQAEFRMTPGNTTDDFGLTWNTLDQYNSDYFVVNSTGECKVGFIDNGKRTDIEYAPVPKAAGTGPRKLKIVKMGGRLDFYVNDDPVILGSRTGQYYGNSIGFVVFGVNTVPVSSVHVAKYSNK